MKVFKRIIGLVGLGFVWLLAIINTVVRTVYGIIVLPLFFIGYFSYKRHIFPHDIDPWKNKEIQEVEDNIIEDIMSEYIKAARVMHGMTRFDDNEARLKIYIDEIKNFVGV